MFPDHNYVSLDIPSVAARAEESPAEFPPPVLIDQVQYAPKLFRHLKIAEEMVMNKPSIARFEIAQFRWSRSDGCSNRGCRPTE